ncbi:sigma-70 family RNA polymerase sigma factor [Saccharopolyspora hirsuta]|uniref:Sigma-70 family RNA polymerase sigma factor n=1 Tax=Saccharopolyspora hirsuta TaxID=1837 RepID=A0A5M7BZR8_SACHI|nr:sigma-70 family RNA polymerase sigma factor [Saccharopolyspora hirsuta]KAA5833707.1 sigma-70 family RNA polymerase sigma factor [Saccharopolyspora hirsuta]
MATIPAEVQGPSDGELLEAVRSGSSAAYAQLYERHVGAAYNMARQVARSAAEADDLVSEAFAKVLDTLRDGRGPTTAFRAYLLTALRHTAYDRTRRERKLQLADDVAEVSGADVSVPFTDTAVAGLERTLAAQAFARLPERWQTVLWHVEVEGQTPAQVAPLLGLTPNGVSALAYRAREGLRQAYLQVHLGQLDDSESGVEHCRATVDRLGAWTRRGLSKRETAQVESHLDGCDRCRALAAELADVNGALRVIIAPLVLGSAATGYLAVSSSGGASAAALAAGSASGAAGAATAVLATAVAIAMTSGTDQTVPLASAPPAPIVQPAEPPNPPAPPPPAPPQPPQAPQAPSPAPQPPAPQPPAPPAPAPPPAPTPPPPPPATPVLNASGPGQPIQLVAGGDPVDLPITVSNSGAGDSEPVTTALDMPSGVSAQLPGAMSSEPASTVPQSRSLVLAQPPGSPSVSCQNRSSTITCTTDRGLRPGESFTFNFRVRADESSQGGEITASISAGAEIELHLDAVPVVVEPAPVDKIDLQAWSWPVAEELWSWPTSEKSSRLFIWVTNVGTSTGRAEAIAELPEGMHAQVLTPECDVLPGQDRVRCSDDLSPRESMLGVVQVTDPQDVPDPVAHSSTVDPASPEAAVQVTANLGTSSDSELVPLRFPLPPPPPKPPECSWWPWWPPGLDHHRPPWCWWPEPAHSPLVPPTTSSSEPTTTSEPPSTTSPTAPPTSTAPPTTTPPTTSAPPTSSTPPSTTTPPSSTAPPSSSTPPTSSAPPLTSTTSPHGGPQPR